MSLASELLHWYDANARVLPWRSAPSPYKVWVSEIMLQQTRVEAVLPYFNRFLDRFPDIQSLASSDQQDVLLLWEGLGYYSRARNLHKAAKVIVQKHEGELPSSSQALLKLPGIGKYTAAAISSIAFGEAIAAVDGNIKRVYARVLGTAEPLGSSVFEKTINSFAQVVLPKERPGDFTQALMDLGSAICVPKNPKCELCPISTHCQAFTLNMQDQLPVIAPKAATPHYDVCVAAIIEGGRVLLMQRAQSGLLAGLWEFPGGKKQEGDTDLEACLRREIEGKYGIKLAELALLGVFKHAYTHFRITVHAWRSEPDINQMAALNDNLHWIKLDELANYPMGKVARMIARKIT